ncbi:hypothetical protein ID875_29200 [Streptomyces globisporus]|uniref:Uncharacterized protein n=1 Tax=Streptomyces globisporus TaxID=1908 RepID=A0A927GPI3_STRGL|nr:hypothetical protein [Streptomyces globisporus]
MTGEEALLNFCAWYIDRHDVLPHDRLCQTAPLTFDPSVQQLFPAWLTARAWWSCPTKCSATEGSSWTGWPPSGSPIWTS